MKAISFKFASVVLAGGKSSRMGKDKALLLTDSGKSFLARACELGASICGDNVLISGRDLPDKFPGLGPLAGIHSAIDYSVQSNAYDYLLFFPVDMPKLSKETLLCLIENCSDQQALYFAGYELPCLVKVSSENLKLLIEIFSAKQQKLSLKNFLAKISVTAINLPSGRQNEFININTPEEYLNECEVFS